MYTDLNVLKLIFKLYGFFIVFEVNFRCHVVTVHIEKCLSLSRYRGVKTDLLLTLYLLFNGIYRKFSHCVSIILPQLFLVYHNERRD
jgi:hypothetical protein